ncbi:ABC transporter ATP-binding protein/permease [Paenibacillus sp. ACRSA]|uniref:ABC transporter ATP-binding protein n=1 Tax=Paenibacillus sp. ACRSA TaxID=2918211 RepID=UPI001EF71427|nr:ABC transporter ATP-binding protein [Paenibacillus sp. ACRSA]MCG7376549.1 ABC transporter ATP-binding protein/permease [Paenibacillus sp. ACRSA]
MWNSTKNSGKLFLLIYKTNKGQFFASSFLHILQGLVPFFSLIVMQNLLNAISSTMINGVDIVLIPFAVFVLLYLAKLVINSGQTFVEGNLENSLAKSLNIMICQKSTQLGLADYENSSINDQLKRASQEAGFRPYQLYSQLAGIASSLITVISSSTWLFLWKWWTVPIILVVSLASLYSLFKINKQQFEIYMERTPYYRQSWYLTYLLTNDRAVKEVKIFQLSSYLLNRYSGLLEGFYKVDKKMLGKLTKYTLVYNLVELAVMLWLVWLVIKETLRNTLMIGSLYGYIQAIMLTQSQVQSIMRNLLQFSQNHLYMEQLFLFIDLPTSDPLMRSSEQSNELGMIADKRSSFSIEQLELRNVSFQYLGQEKQVLNNVSLTFNKGETVAIVGKNGSGKTTLMKILMQLYDDFNGNILVNGHNIKEYNLMNYQKKIGAVFQDFVHYEMSVRQNIGFGSLEQMDQDDIILDAAKYASIDQVIRTLPQGLDTQLGKWFEDGQQLSGGQWQRLAIARAFMRNADLYILDEPSAFLDPVAERDLLELFLDLMKDKIGIFITHRLSSARLAHRIIVMEDGKVIEQGTHEALLQRNGAYAEMYQIQAKSFSDESSREEVYQS